MTDRKLDGNELELSLLGLRFQKIVEGVKNLHGLEGEDVDLFIYDLTMVLNNEFRDSDVTPITLAQKLHEIPASIYAMMPDFETTLNMEFEEKMLFFKISSPHRKYDIYGVEKFSDNKEKFSVLAFDKDEKEYFQSIITLDDLRESDNLSGFPYYWQKDFSPCKIKDIDYANRLLMDRIEGRRKPDLPYVQKNTEKER